jgi:hypothetical protein
LCCSRRLFFQINPTFQRFHCKVFLTGALRYMGGAVERFGFRFVAHERGDANRSARVERPFSFIENNFLAGRTFARWDDRNQQARQWCDRVNPACKKHIRAGPRGRPARTVRPRAKAPETAAGVDSGSVSSASTHGGR